MNSNLEDATDAVEDPEVIQRPDYKSPVGIIQTVDCN